MAGRKPKPTHLKIINGNPGKRPLNKREPTFAPSLPVPPDYLGETAKGIFLAIRDHLEEMGYASSSHTEALTLVALRLEEVQQCTEIINLNGFTYVTLSTQGEPIQKVRPEVMIRNEAARHAQSLLAEFGLTPSSATKVVVPGKQRKNAFSSL